MSLRHLCTFVCLLFGSALVNAKELYHLPENKSPRWISFENPEGKKGAGAMENKGAKGHPADRIMPGETVDLVNFEGSGTVRRIWLTLGERSPEMLRSLLIPLAGRVHFRLPAGRTATSKAIRSKMTLFLHSSTTSKVTWKNQKIYLNNIPKLQRNYSDE